MSGSYKYLGLLPMPDYVDLVTFRDAHGRPHSYARTYQGFHVPIESLAVDDLKQALRFRPEQNWPVPGDVGV